jgi:hypothetical protein
MEAGPLDRLWSRRRTSLGERGRWLRSEGFQVAQCAIAGK